MIRAVSLTLAAVPCVAASAPESGDGKPLSDAKPHTAQILLFPYPAD